MSETAEKKDGPPIGIFDGISNADYHASHGISKSGLDKIRQSPAHYWLNRQQPSPPTPAMVLGSAFHALVLEPDVFDQTYVMEPVDAPKRPTARQVNAAKPSKATLEAIDYWQQWDAENDGKVMIKNTPGEDAFWKPGDWDRLHAMRDAVLDHPNARILLDPDQGKAEQSVYWVDQETYRLCKCRPDFINEAHNTVIDLKSTDDASYTGFTLSCAKWRHHVQEAFYRDGMHAIGRTITGFIFIAVERTPPWGVGVYTLSQDDVRIGRDFYQQDLHRYHECMAKASWPAYPEEIREIQLPPWSRRGHIA